MLILIISSVSFLAMDRKLKKVANTKKMDKQNLEYLTFGGGCFWCVESCFDLLNGVDAAISGYSGGHKANPTYEEVCTGETGHAEVVQLAYNPKIISYEQLMYIVFCRHDPTTLNRQGVDIGTQYRSVIYYKDDAEKKKAEDDAKAKKEADKLAKAPIKKQLTVWVDSFSINLPNGELLNNETALRIETKFDAFKKWAKSEIENI